MSNQTDAVKGRQYTAEERQQRLEAAAEHAAAARERTAIALSVAKFKPPRTV